MPRKPKGQKRKRDAVNEEDDEVIINVPKAKKAKQTFEEPVEPRRSPNGYILPDPLPAGLIITDLRKNKWKLGKSVGLGGFGEIYSAACLNGTKVSKEDYVVKVEPHTNGPLFVELNFYCRATRKEGIEDFAKLHKLDHLGIPDLKGSGSFFYRNKRLRFIVMPRYGTDLQTMLDASKSALSLESACSVATQVIDCYQYLHSKGYVHKDLKGSNILFARGQPGRSSRKKVFLVDYGLTSRYLQHGLHKPFEPDLRSAHEGTLEYTSRDAHLGCVSRRGDIEVLVYVLIDWLGGKLPWDVEDGAPSLKPPAIQQMKIEAFHDIKGFLSAAFRGLQCPPFLENLMSCVKKMRFEEAPDYNYLKSLFLPYLKSGAKKRSDSFEEVSLSLELENGQRILNDDDDNDEEVTIKRQLLVRKPSKRRTMPLNLKRQNSTSQPWTPSQMESYQEQRAQIIRNLCDLSLQNPTPAMCQQLARIQERCSSGSPSVSSTTRRKGMVGKRRLTTNNNGRRGPNQVPSNMGEQKAVTGSFLLALAPTSGNGDSTTMALIRKSPRKSRRAEEPSYTLSQHLAHFVGPVSKFVRSMFQAQQSSTADE